MIPFSAWEGLAVIGGVIVLLFPWKRWGIARWGILASLLLLVAFHSYSSPTSGWSVCLKRTVAPETLQTPCEPSAEFRDGSATFIASKIDWAEDFIPLYFMNDKQAFNFYKDTEPDRKHLSYFFQATTTAQGGSDHILRATTTLPDVTVVVDGISSHLNTNNPLSISLPEDRAYSITATYNHVRTSHDALSLSAPLVRTWKDTFSAILYAIVWILFLISIGYGAWSSLLRMNASKRRMLFLVLFPLLFLFVADELWQWTFFVGFLGIWYAWTSSKEEKNIILPSLLFLGFHIARVILTSQPFEDVFLPYSAGFLSYLILIGCFAITMLRKQGKSVVPWILVLLLVNAFAYTQYVNPYGKLVLFTGGDDELTHEGFARESLLSTDLKDRLIAGEAYRFYYQPLYRYAIAGIHEFWGESMFGPYVLQTFLLSVSFVSLLYAISLLGIPFSMLVFSVLFGIANLLPTQSLLSVTQRGFQQGLGTPLLFISIAFLVCIVLQRYSIRFLVLTGIILGLTISIRTDYVPIVVVAYLVLLWGFVGNKEWKKRLYYLLIFTVALALFPALIVLRNGYVDGLYAFMPTSGLYNLTDPYGSIFAGKNLKEIGSGTALLTILYRYSGNVGELLQLMWRHISTEFIGTLPIRMIIWYGGFISVFFALLRTYDIRNRIALLILLLTFVGLLFPNLFFVQHNGIAMRAQYDVILMAMLALGIGSLCMKQTLVKKL